LHKVTTHERAHLASTSIVVFVLTVTVVAASHRWGIVGAAVVAVMAPALAAAVTDARSGRIPNSFVFVAALPPLGVAGWTAASGLDLGPLAAILLGAVAFAAPVGVAHLVSPGSMGFGDVKLAAVLGAALGLIEPRLGLLALCLAAAVTAAVGLVRRRPSLPFGPGLVLGATMALVIAGLLGEEAQRWY